MQTVKYLIKKGNLLRLAELIQLITVKGDLTIIKAMHQRLSGYISYQLYYHATHNACYYGHLPVLKYFVSIGQKLHQDHLYSAIRHGHPEIVKYLTNLGIKHRWKLIKKIRIQNEMELIRLVAQFNKN